MTTLDTIEKNQSCLIQRIDDKAELRRQLLSRGFVRGAVVTMIRNHRTGPILVEVRHARLALGRAEAKKIIVRPSNTV